MATLTPVDTDPFADGAPVPAQNIGATFTPVDHDPFAAPDGVTNPPTNPGYILPMSEDASGGLHFDSNAGVLGMAKSLVGIPQKAINASVNLTAAQTAQDNSEPGTPAYNAAASQAADSAGTMLGVAATASPLTPTARVLGGAAGITMGPGKIDAPSGEALSAAAGKQYDQARNMGVDYSSGAVSNLATQMRAALEQDGILAELAPKTHAILSKLETPPADPSVVPFGGIEAARRALGHAGGDFNNPTDQLAAGRAISGIDDFVAAADPSSVVAGPADAVGQIAQDARANYAASKRVEQLTNLKDNANLRADATNSGANLGNNLRQRAATIVGNPQMRAGFTTDEVDSLRTIAQGTMPQNLTRKVGNIFGGGGGLGALAAGAVGSAAGIGGVTLPAIGYAAKTFSNKSTEGLLDKAIGDTAKRSPLFAQMQADAPMVAPQDGLLSRFLKFGLTGAATDQAN